jgi:DNA-binding response OmpR family regulator
MTTVLNIQAHEQTMLLMHWILSEDGFNVIDALGARPATLALPHRPNVVVINTEMETTEKRACIHALRELVPGVSILDLGVDAELDTYDTGADQYLNKPFSGHDLIARVRACEA